MNRTIIGKTPRYEDAAPHTSPLAAKDSLTPAYNNAIMTSSLMISFHRNGAMQTSSDQIQQELTFEKTLIQGSVKAAMHAVNAAKRDLWQVPPGAIRVIEGFNVRTKDDEYYAHVRGLADSMKQEGFYPEKPLSGYIAREGDEQIVYIHDGHCRLEGALLAISEGAEIERIPVVVSAAGTSMEDLTVSLVRSNSGKPLTTYETAIVCKRLARFGWTSAEIAKRLGFSSAQYVDQLLILAAAPIEIRQMVIDRLVSATIAIETLIKHGDKALEILLAAQANATGKSNGRITQRALPGAMFAKAVKKAAVPMHTMLRDITADPAYGTLAPSIREKLDQLLKELDSKTDDLVSGQTAAQSAGEQLANTTPT